MALPKLNKDFVGRATALGLGAAAVLTPLTGVFAGDGKTVPPVATTTMAATTTQAVKMTKASTAATSANFTPAPLKDAGGNAQDWSLENPGIAVAVFLGTESGVTPTQIRDILTNEINSAGVKDVAFFFEQNDVAGTGVAYAYSGAVDGPFHLGDAREAAAKSAQQYMFQQNNPALAFNYNQ